ncbi:hypothetical protein Tsubulata_032882, partial [Turnera subulata]
MQSSLLFKELQKSLQKQNLLYKRLSNHISTNVTCGNNNVKFSSWDSLISDLSRGGPCAELALHETSRLFNSGSKPNGYHLVHLVRSFVDLGLDSCCLQLHTYILRSGFSSNVFVSNALIRFYRVIESMVDVHQVFVEITQPSVVSWNSLISGYVHSGYWRKALGLFLQLEKSNVCADAYSFTLALSASGQLGMLRFGQSVHCKIVKYGLECGVFVANCLVDMYGKCGLVEDAIWVFDGVVDKDTISWNSAIAASTRNQRLELAYHLFNQMPEPDTISYNELINGIAQFGSIADAVRILAKMPNPNSSSWNSIITGYVNRNRAQEALKFFTEMHSSDVHCAMRMIYDLSFAWSGVVWRALLGACSVCGDLKVANIAAAKVIQLEGDDDYVYVMMSNIFASYGKWGEVNKVRKLMIRRGVTKEVGRSWIEVEKPIL